MDFIWLDSSRMHALDSRENQAIWDFTGGLGFTHISDMDEAPLVQRSLNIVPAAA